MKTDSLFYRLFQRRPSLLFELIGEMPASASGYRFQSVELKQTAFRLDGVFAPPDGDEVSPIVFLEVQFQGEKGFYIRLISEVALYIRQYQPANPWKIVVLYPSRVVDTGETYHFEPLLNSPQVQRIYLDELGEVGELPLMLGLVCLIVTPEPQAMGAVQQWVARARAEVGDAQEQGQLLDLVETIMVYKFSRLSRQEIQQMLGFTETDLKQTRFYQDVFAEGQQAGRQEGRQEEAVNLLLRLLTRRFGEVEGNVQTRIRQLTVAQLEALAEALLEFTSVADLVGWLEQSE
ncbi:Rpn family recombination-promoting nuclease/putative transposase [Trichothermofontia sp.]